MRATRTSEDSGYNWTGRYRQLQVEFNPGTRALWYRMRPAPRPCFTPILIDELRHFQVTAAGLDLSGSDAPRALVLASALPGTFILGGDLDMFRELIQSGQRDTLARYAQQSIDVLYANLRALERPLLTVSLVQGQALGGGFEAALSSQVLVAERSARFGFPEALFDMFPGMGAWNMLARCLDGKRATEMITGGRFYSATELHALGLVDVVAEDGQGEAVVNALLSDRQCLQNIRPKPWQTIGHAELALVAAYWVDCALALGPRALRNMARLQRAQDRVNAAARSHAA